MFDICSMLVKPQIASNIVGIIINVMTENMRGEACFQEYLFEHFNSEENNGFLHDLSVTSIDKTYAKNPIKREH